MTAAIRFEDVGYRIGSSVLLRNLTFEVAEGERLVLLGQSGSGKTTTLKLINHLLIPTTGTVFVNGKSTREWDPIVLRRRIGYVIQEIGLFPHYTVSQNVALVPTLEKWDRGRTEKRVSEVLRLVGLDPESFGGRYPRELSGGQRQRVGVARALCADPPMLLMDEPFGALDPVSRSEVQAEFQQLQGQLSKTIIFVTHDVAEALRFGNRIGLMKDGRLLAMGSPAEFAATRDPEVRSFLAPLREMVQTLSKVVE